MAVAGGFSRCVGREILRALRYRPQALHIVAPLGALLHSGVLVVPQLEHTCAVMTLGFLRSFRLCCGDVADVDDDGETAVSGLVPSGDFPAAAASLPLMSTGDCSFLTGAGVGSAAVEVGIVWESSCVVGCDVAVWVTSGANAVGAGAGWADRGGVVAAAGMGGSTGGSGCGSAAVTSGCAGCAGWGSFVALGSGALADAGCVYVDGA